MLAIKTALSSWTAAAAKKTAQLSGAASLHTTPAAERGRRGPGYGFHCGPYLQLYQPEDGSRAHSDNRALARFKRLDWGVYIRPKGGRRKKHWMKDGEGSRRALSQCSIKIIDPLIYSGRCIHPIIHPRIFVPFSHPFVGGRAARVLRQIPRQEARQDVPVTRENAKVRLFLLGCVLFIARN